MLFLFRTVRRIGTERTLLHRGSSVVYEEKGHRFVQTLYAWNLKQLSLSLSSGVTVHYFIAFDRETNRAGRHLLVCAHCEISFHIRNTYFMVVEVYKYHTGENNLQLIPFVLRAVIGQYWAKQSSNFTTNAVEIMKGIHSKAGSRLQNTCPYTLFRVWCVCHHLDVLEQHVFRQQRKDP